MKSNQKQTSQFQQAAFTLVEMLVVVAIVAILASILIPVVGRAKTKAKVAVAKAEMAGLEAAIKSYKTDYNRWPIPKRPPPPAPWINEGGDFTYGLTNIIQNEALMEILMAKDGRFNQGHGRNPKKNKYIEPKESGEVDGFPGLSTTGRYHDPFGNEYFISLDLSGDGICADAAYCPPSVSGSPGGGLVGLVSYKTIRPTAPDIYVYKGEVMIWSFGPDKTGGAGAASEGSNEDNILSWR
jgi:prepilin-type N-terminal cleavage/methylation domain-containing protein